MQIFAKSVNGEVIVLEVTKSDRIFDLKKKIEELVGLLSSEQKLAYQARILEDDKTIHYYRISEKGFINVIDRLRDAMPIIIRSMDGKNIELEVAKSHRIAEVKKKIQTKMGLSSNQLILMFKSRLLDDRETVEYYQFEEKCVVNLILRDTISVNIKMKSGESMRLSLTSGDRVIDIKKKIEEKVKVHVCEQMLVHKDIELNNRMSIGDCQINDNGTVHLALRDGFTNNRGLCVVISNKKFSGGFNSRLGTNEDEKNITETFKPLGFEIQIHRDVVLSGIGTILKQTMESIKDTNTMLILFILSHGYKDNFITSDGLKFPINDVCLPFTNTNFSKLCGRPKLFFFVCCQGSSVPKEKAVESSEQIRSNDDSLNSIAADPPSIAMSDMFLGHSTCRSYTVCHDCEKRSSYVCSLCDVISKKPEWSIYDAHQEVQRRLSIKSFQNNGHHMPYCTSYLTKHAYFINSDF